jgi:hypothetical protein
MTPHLEHVFDLVVELARSHEMGACPVGTRRIIPIVGGTASGPAIEGRVLNVGADWQTVFANGVADLDARYAIGTKDGAVIEVISQGIRHASPEIATRIAEGEQVSPSDYYMRTAMRLETGHSGYAWVNRSLFLASGGKVGSTVRLSVYRVD